ncbi:MAG: DUF4384 domain-containing protein [Nitrospirales bacterium]
MYARLAIVVSAVILPPLFAESVTHALDNKPKEWVEGIGVFYLSDATTVESAKRASHEAARRDAIQRGVGVYVTGTTQIRNHQLTDDLIRTVVRGMIVEEQILEQGLKVEEAKGTPASYRTHINARVVGLPSKHDTNFSVYVRPNQSVFRHGQHAEIRISATQDAYLYVFNVTEDDHITTLVPNRYLPDSFLKTGAEFVFPPDSLVKRGIQLTTLLPHGKKHATEKIKVIASRHPLGMLSHHAPEAIFDEHQENDTSMLQDLIKTLSTLDPGEWAEETAVYEIVP